MRLPEGDPGPITSLKMFVETRCTKDVADPFSENPKVPLSPRWSTVRSYADAPWWTGAPGAAT
eukprot:14392820-Alexandrium_andersonii.AAC.1